MLQIVSLNVENVNNYEECIMQRVHAYTFSYSILQENVAVCFAALWTSV